jgi:hypothetical protein
VRAISGCLAIGGVSASGEIRYVPVLIEISSEAEENEVEIPLGGPSSPPANDNDSGSSLSTSAEEPSGSPTVEESESNLAGPGNQDENRPDNQAEGNKY